MKVIGAVVDLLTAVPVVVMHVVAALPFPVLDVLLLPATIVVTVTLLLAIVVVTVVLLLAIIVVTVVLLLLSMIVVIVVLLGCDGEGRAANAEEDACGDSFLIKLLTSGLSDGLRSRAVVLRHNLCAIRTNRVDTRLRPVFLQSLPLKGLIGRTLFAKF